jgi:phage terminase large subunit-like protein
VSSTWAFHVRDEQRPPEGDWTTWIYLGGRGAGKTRAGAEWVRARVEEGCRRIAIVGANANDARYVMVEGESGLLSVASPWLRAKYEPSKRLITWPNGAIATLFSAEEPDMLRGPQHDTAWCDELAKWTHLEAAWDNDALPKDAILRAVFMDWVGMRDADRACMSAGEK